MRPARLILLLCTLALLPAALIACGGDDEDSGSSGSDSAGSTTTEAADDSGGSGDSGGGGTVAIAADPDGALAYTETELSAPAGEVEVEFENESSTGHDVVLEDEDGTEVGRTDVITESSDSFSVDLPPGTYTYYCSVPGHREAGMEGTLTVE